MNKILIHIEPGGDERDRLVAWAADLVEAITAPINEAGQSSTLEIGVVADVLNCLEIGVVMLGRAAPRTVEGGERNVSPVTLFPFRSAGGDESTTELTNALECLRELAERGAVEGFGGGSTEDDMLPDAEVALRRALARGAWEGVVALGESDGSSAAIREWSERSMRSRVVRPVPDEGIHERVDTLLRRLEPPGEDTYRRMRRLAVQNAVQFGAMLEQLGLEP